MTISRSPLSLADAYLSADPFSLTAAITISRSSVSSSGTSFSVVSPSETSIRKASRSSWSIMDLFPRVFHLLTYLIRKRHNLSYDVYISIFMNYNEQGG